MNKFLFSTCVYLAFSQLTYADIVIDPQDISQEEIAQSATSTPFSLSTHIDYINGAKINKGFYKGDKIEFGEGEAIASMVVYYNPCLTEGIRVSAGYTATYLHWCENPWFDQEHFNQVDLSVAGFTKRVKDWFWRTELTASFDADEWSFQYTTYDIILWGRYDLCENIGLHIGAFIETGCRMDRVYPILGFDWQITEKWRLDAVFPTNITLAYAFAKKWSLGAAARFFDPRFRVHSDEHSLKPLVRYTTMGAEFFVKYGDDKVTANIHCGSTLGGRFRVANRHNDHAKGYYLDPALYGGAEIEVVF